MSGVTYTGQLNASALATTFLHVQEWLEENPSPDPSPIATQSERGDEEEVVEIARRYMDTGELRMDVGMVP